MLNIAVLVSGSGTNLQAIIDAKAAGKLPNGRIACVISSKKGAFALKRAASAGIATQVLAPKSFTGKEEFDTALLQTLRNYQIDFIVLAGYMSILSSRIIEEYRNKIINVHPSLIPSFCGQGYYGLKVHEKALEYGVKITGATVHFVNEITDGGEIILQKAVDVKQDDTPESLQRRVMEEAEWEILPKAISLFCNNKISIIGRKTIIEER